jgi:endonuclease YncB( thermonuclease family)
MRQWIATLLLIAGGSCWAADAIVKDGDTLILGDTSYKLDGIDAPEPDQVCLDEKGTIWRCGIEARDRLAKLIDSRTVRCDDKGPDPAYPARRIGVCWIDDQNLNQLLVRDGWAVNFEPYAKGRFKADESDAEKNRRGLWKGCFLAPHDFRHWNKQTAKLYGLTCSDDATSRNNLLPDHPAMPAGCPIKGNPKSGIYYTEGCRSYRSYENPKRWFCSEEEAQAAGFRKAKNCRTTYVGRASRAWA